MTTISRLAVLAVVGLLLVAAGTKGEEKKITLDKLPKVVLDAVKARFPGAQLKGAEEEKEDGKTIYEIALTLKEQSFDVSLTPDGKIIEIEKAISTNDLPKAVTDAIGTKYPKASIKRAEEVTKGDQVGYEVLLVTADKKTIEVELDSKGKILEEEIKGEKKSDKK